MAISKHACPGVAVVTTIKILLDTVRTFARRPLACGGMVLYDSCVAFFALWAKKRLHKELKTTCKRKSCVCKCCAPPSIAWIMNGIDPENDHASSGSWIDEGVEINDFDNL